MSGTGSNFTLCFGGAWANPPGGRGAAGVISDESPELECSSRQDPYDSACCIYQRQDSRQCQKAESYRLAYQVMMQFAREVIFANGAERRLATISPSATDIVEHRCLITIVRLRGHTASAPSGPDQTMSMIKLEHWF